MNDEDDTKDDDDDGTKQSAAIIKRAQSTCTFGCDPQLPVHRNGFLRIAVFLHACIIREADARRRPVLLVG